MSERNETVYRTNIDAERTIELLRNIPDMDVRYEPGSPPRGIFPVHFREGRVKAKLGSQGGLQTHWLGFENLQDFLYSLESVAVTKDSQPLRLTKTKERFGRLFYEKEYPV